MITCDESLRVVTCSKLDVCGFHFSSGRPCHVLSTDRQTLPSLYKLGLKRTVCRPVVARCTCNRSVPSTFININANKSARYNGHDENDHIDGKTSRNMILFNLLIRIIAIVVTVTAVEMMRQLTFLFRIFKVAM